MEARLHDVSSVSVARMALGESGEDLACHELERRGYAIVARRFRVRGGELDIVARDGGVLVFVEVKTRSGRRYGTAAEAVTSAKQHRIARLAHEYLARHHMSDCACRFDVVTVQLDAVAPAVEIVRNAFDV
jgi:putative endonuclease